jgi:hypothetical protein
MYKKERYVSKVRWRSGPCFAWRWKMKVWQRNFPKHEDGMGTNKISTASLHYRTNLNTSSKLRGSFDLYAELQLISFSH